jgi:hypothetical protein
MESFLFESRIMTNAMQGDEVHPIAATKGIVVSMQSLNDRLIVFLGCSIVLCWSPCWLCVSQYSTLRIVPIYEHFTDSFNFYLDSTSHENLGIVATAAIVRAFVGRFCLPSAG